MATAGVASARGGVGRMLSAEAHEAAAVATPTSRLQRLALAKDPEVRLALARRADCPMGILATLAFDRVADVRVAVAANGRITLAVAEHLATDRHPGVLKALARNEAIPLALLESLASHRKEEVRRVAGRCLDARAERGPAAEPQMGTFSWTLGRRPIVSALPGELRDRVRPAPGAMQA